MKPEYQEKTADLPQVTNNHSLIYICIHLLRIDVILNANVPGSPISSTNKTDHYNITEILLKVALNTITLTLYFVLVI
jgi:hypothetical protein